MRILAILVGVGALVAFGVFVLGSGPPPAPASAKALESTLLAPCCFGGTIDVHDSDIARQLRGEIESRVAHGESTTSVQADLVARYGPEIRAMPNAGAFSATMATVMLAILIGGVLVVRLMGGWRRSEGPTAKAPAEPMARDAQDDRLDAELEALE